MFALLPVLRSIPAHLGHFPAPSTQLHAHTPGRGSAPPGSRICKPKCPQQFPASHLLRLHTPPRRFNPTARPALESQCSQALRVRAGTKHNLLTPDQLFVLHAGFFLVHKPARPSSTRAASAAHVKPTAAFQPSPWTPRSIPQMVLGIPEINISWYNTVPKKSAAVHGYGGRAAAPGQAGGIRPQ